MALAAAVDALFDCGVPSAVEGVHRKRFLFVLLGISVAMTLVGLLVAFTRPIKWPANIGSPQWRRPLGEKVEHLAEEAGA
jgi:hypothetical protein